MADEALNRTNVYSLGLIIRGAFLFCAVALLLHSGKSPWMQTLSLTFVSIVLEAFPFMLLGTLVGGFIEEFVSREKLASILPQKKTGTVLIAAGMGIIFSVCECAVVPVTRRFLRKGIPFSAALAYLLAGPIVNPIVFASTAVAYGLDRGIALITGICGSILALLVSSTLGLTFKRNDALSPELGHEVIGGPFSPSSHGHATGSLAGAAGNIAWPCDIKICTMRRPIRSAKAFIKRGNGRQSSLCEVLGGYLPIYLQRPVAPTSRTLPRSLSFLVITKMIEIDPVFGIRRLVS